jgi:hypothetical protein
MQETLRDAEIVPLGVGYYTVREAARLLKTQPRKITRSRTRSAALETAATAPHGR